MQSKGSSKMEEVKEDQAVEETTEVNQDEGEESTQDEVITVGDKKLSQDEVNDLVEKGMTVSQFEKEHPDTNITELHKAFTQARQEIAELKKSREEQPVKPEDQERYKQIDSLFEDQYFEKKLADKIAKKTREEQEDKLFKDEVKRLQEELNGKDGRPKFVYNDVLLYGKEHGILNPQAAYKDMYEKELIEWNIKNALSRKPKSTYSERRAGAGSTLPKPKEPSTWAEARAAAEAREQDYKQE